MDVGVIGVGAMGRNHVRVYSELKGVDTVYVYDPVAESAARSRDVAEVCDTLQELLRKAEAVSICVPTRYHFQVAGQVIEAGVNCLIEKPITLTAEEGAHLIEAIEARRSNSPDLVVGVGHIERFNPIVAEMARIAGRPDYVCIKRHNPTSSRITDASVVEDLMIHDIDIVFNALFPGERDCKIFSAGSVNVCEAMAVFSGCVVSLSASRLSCKKFRTLYVESQDFTAEGDFMTQEVYIYRKPGKYGLDNERYTQENIIEKVLVNKVEPLKVELKTFLDCINRTTSFPVSPLQALHNLQVCEQIKMGLHH